MPATCARLLCASCLALTLIAGAARAESDKLALTLHPPKGAAYSVTLVTDQQIEQTLEPRGKVTSSYASTITVTYRVEDVDSSGVLTIRVTYTGMEVKSVSNGRSLAGNSADPSGKSPLDAICRALVGKFVSLELSPKGEVTKVIGAKGFVDDMVAAIAKQSPVGRAEAERQIRETYTEEWLTGQARAVFRVLPAEPAKVKDSWKNVQTLQPLGVSLENTFVLESAERNSATISATGVVKASEPITRNINGLAMKMTLSGKQKATYVLDMSTGMPSSTKIEQAVDGQVEATTADGKTDSRWPLTLRAKNSVTISESPRVAAPAPATATAPR